MKTGTQEGGLDMAMVAQEISLTRTEKVHDSGYMMICIKKRYGFYAVKSKENPIKLSLFIFSSIQIEHGYLYGTTIHN